jgi:hypothetical protein
MKFITLLISVVLISLCSGCASWPQHGVTAGQNEKFRIAVLPVDVTAEVAKAAEITTSPAMITDEESFIRERMQSVASEQSRYMFSKLKKSQYIEPVLVDEKSIINPQALTVEQLKQIEAEYNVRAVLVVKLAGYGKLERKWIAYLIGSGVVEGVVQGVVAARIVDNTWVGVAVALEEIGQEVLVWGGGAYLFNQHFSPVTLEAQLLSTADGEEIWDDTVFKSIDKKGLEKLPEEERGKREIQLRLTAKNAFNELVDDINKKAKNNQGIE